MPYASLASALKIVHINAYLYLNVPFNPMELKMFMGLICILSHKLDAQFSTIAYTLLVPCFHLQEHCQSTAIFEEELVRSIIILPLHVHYVS